MFVNLLRDSDLFEEGIYVCPPEIATGALEKYTAPPRLLEIDHRSDRDLPIRVVQPLYSLPHWRIPAMQISWARQIHEQLEEQVIQGRPYCLWMNCPGILSNALARELAPAAKYTIFDSSDDFKARPESSLEPLVDELSALSDHVLCVNQPTADHIEHPNKTVFANCTSWDTFQTRKPGFRLSPFFPKPPGQVYIGFIGGIHSTRADEALLDRLFREFPRYRFLFIGYTDRDDFLKRLTAHENVSFLPEVPHPDLSEVIRAFDVAIVPHVNNSVTRGNDLLKVLDYFACNVPVVSTRCSGVECYGKALYLANNHDEFVSFLVKLATGTIAHDPRLGEAIARERSWERQVPVLAEAIRQLIESADVPSVELAAKVTM